MSPVWEWCRDNSGALGVAGPEVAPGQNVIMQSTGLGSDVGAIRLGARESRNFWKTVHTEIASLGTGNGAEQYLPSATLNTIKIKTNKKSL